MPRRPWWLLANSVGGAAFYCLLSLLQIWLFFANNHGRLATIWIVLWVACLIAMVSTSVATFIAYWRHPDWVNRTWARPNWGRRARLALSVGMVMCIALAVVALVVALILRSDIAGGIAIFGILAAIACIAQRSLLSDSTADHT